MKYIQQNIIGKKFPILRFYNINFPEKYNKEFKINDNIVLFDEINNLKELNNYNYYLFVNAGHMIYLDKNATNSILEKI